MQESDLPVFSNFALSWDGLEFEPGRGSALRLCAECLLQHGLGDQHRDEHGRGHRDGRKYPNWGSDHPGRHPRLCNECLLHGLGDQHRDEHGRGQVAIIPLLTTPQVAIQDLIDVLQAIVDTNPGTPLADKIEDVIAKLQTALDELNKEAARQSSGGGKYGGGGRRS